MQRDHLEADCDLPDSDFQHAAEQFRVVGDNPPDVDDQLLLKDGLPLPAVNGALAVDDALDHPRRQRVGDHHLFVPKEAEGHLRITGISKCTPPDKKRRHHILLQCIKAALLLCVCEEHVYTLRLACEHSTSSKVQFLQVSLFHHSKIGLLSQSHIKVSREKNCKITLLYFVLSESHLMKITPRQSS